MNKLLILYKIEKQNNNEFGKIYELTTLYANKFNNIDSYFIVSDNTIEENYKIDNKIIYIKTINNNWESILIKVIVSFQLFINSEYTHILVTNISTFINMPLIYNKLNDSDCLSHKGNYTFNTINYCFPSGAGYIFSINLVKMICKFFNDHLFINNNILSNNFITHYPTTDDIFFGYYFYLNKIIINDLPRYDIINNNSNTINNNSNTINTNLNYSYYRIKTSKNNNNDNDYTIHLDLYTKLYK